MSVPWRRCEVRDAPSVAFQSNVNFFLYKKNTCTETWVEVKGIKGFSFHQNFTHKSYKGRSVFICDRTLALLYRRLFLNLIRGLCVIGRVSRWRLHLMLSWMKFIIIHNQWRGRGLVAQWAILLLIGRLRKYSEPRNVLIAGISWS